MSYEHVYLLDLRRANLYLSVRSQGKMWLWHLSRVRIRGVIDMSKAEKKHKTAGFETCARCGNSTVNIIGDLCFDCDVDVTRANRIKRIDRYDKEHKIGKYSE